MKKLLSIILAAAMILALLAGCGSKTSEESRAPDPTKDPGTTQTEPAKEPDGGKQYDGVTLAMWSSGEPQANVISEAAAAFEAQTGAKVNIEFKGRDVNKMLSASLEAKEKIDIIEDDYRRIANTYPNILDLTSPSGASTPPPSSCGPRCSPPSTRSRPPSCR